MQPAIATRRKRVIVPDLGVYYGKRYGANLQSLITTDISEFESFLRDGISTYVYQAVNDTWGDTGYSGDSSQFVQLARTGTAAGVKFEILYDPILPSLYTKEVNRGYWQPATDYVAGDYVVGSELDPTLYQVTVAGKSGSSITDFRSNTKFTSQGSLLLNSNMNFYGGNLNQVATGVRDFQIQSFFTRLVAAGLGNADIRYADRLFSGELTARYQINTNKLFGNTNATDVSGGGIDFRTAAARIKSIARAAGWTGRFLFPAGSPGGNYTNLNYVWDASVYDGISYRWYDNWYTPTNDTLLTTIDPTNGAVPLTSSNYTNRAAVLASHFDVMYNDPSTGSLKYWLNFARTVNKEIRLTLGLSYSPNGNGDNPYFFQGAFRRTLVDYADVISGITIDNYSDPYTIINSEVTTTSAGWGGFLAQGNAYKIGQPIWIFTKLSRTSSNPSSWAVGMKQYYVADKDTNSFAVSDVDPSTDGIVSIYGPSTPIGTFIQYVVGTLPTEDHRITGSTTNYPNAGTILGSCTRAWKHKV